MADEASNDTLVENSQVANSSKRKLLKNRDTDENVKSKKR
jgi:hypothetical protein